ncbi:hypothetical protein [Nocardia niwae]|uniref:hypothetical protein n=1 Tax=Nocardia niwae TaxID=626084 RepID=UPI0033E00D01
MKTVEKYLERQGGGHGCDADNTAELAGGEYPPERSRTPPGISHLGADHRQRGDRGAQAQSQKRNHHSPRRPRRFGTHG